MPASNGVRSRPVLRETLLGNIITLVGPNRAVEILGVRLVGVNAENAIKLLFTFIFIAFVVLVGRLVRRYMSYAMRSRDERYKFWVRQGIALGMCLLFILGFVSIWFDDPTRWQPVSGSSLPAWHSLCKRPSPRWQATSSFCAARPSTLATASRWAGCAAMSSLWVSCRPRSWKWVSRPPYKTPTLPCG